MIQALVIIGVTVACLLGLFLCLVQYRKEKAELADAEIQDNYARYFKKNLK